ncbi:MAG TPA: hypothetical protein VNL73_10390 [Verrucomicrobiae bacterium]|nr:hypothetical protein [Verrucomicrobiae bacterium]
MRFRFRQQILTGVLLLSASSVRADFRALAAQSAYILPETFQFSITSSALRRPGDEELFSFPEFGVDYAVAQRVELSGQWGLLFLDRIGQKALGGGGDVLLSTKTALFAHPKNWAAAFRFAVKLPNAKAYKGLGTDEADIFYGLLLSQRLSRFEFSQNLGMGILGNPVTGRGQEDVYTYAISANFKPSRFELFAQWYGQTNTHPEFVFSHVAAGAGYRTGKVGFILSSLKSLTTMPKGYQNTLGADWGVSLKIEWRPI